MDDIVKIANFCMENWRAECDHVLKNANRVCDNRFLFDMPWDMEQTNEEVQLEKINWDFKPKTDPEWTFMLERNGFILHLAQAYALTNSGKFLEKMIALIEDFIANAPLTQASKATSWRSLDCAIRIENWTKAYAIVSEISTQNPAFIQKFTAAIDAHAQYLMSIDTAFTKMSNWGIIGNTGLFCAGVFLKNSTFIDTALARLVESIPMQILPDGTHWEQSPMYHNEVLASLMQVMLLARRNAICLPSEIVGAVRRMTYADVYSAKPNHHQFMQSDSDDTSLQDIITRGAFLLGNSELKFAGYARLDFDTAWQVSMDDIVKYGLLQSKIPSELSVAFQNSGNYYLRSSWKENAALLHFHCGYIGSGHGHADLLHIDLVANGEDILVDSGRYCYEDCEERILLKRPQMHNVLTVDDVDFTQCTSSWGFKNKAAPVKYGMMLQGIGGAKYVEGSHLGYICMENPVFVNRKIVMLDENITIIADTLHTNGTHIYNQYFHFDNAGTVDLLNNVTYQTDKTIANMYFINNKTAFSATMTPYSKHYNLMSKKNTVMATTAANGTTVLITAIVTAPKAAEHTFSVQSIDLFSAKSGEKLTENQACGVKISDSNGDSRIAIFTHDDWIDGVDFIQADGHFVHGRVVVCEEKGGVKTSIVID